jgi:hypothetical protein
MTGLFYDPDKLRLENSTNKKNAQVSLAIRKKVFLLC